MEIIMSRILIIDDEEHIRRMVRITLEAVGYEVGEARDGDEGLRLYATDSNWDLVLLDQRMPGIDGLQTLERLKHLDPGARVVMATAYASIELAVDAMKLGANDFVRKPMTPEVLRNAVSAALAKTKAVSLQTGPRPTQRVPELSSPAIQTITMNGYSIIDPDSDEWRLPDQRRFTVVSPSGTTHDVLVQIDEQLIAYVERITRRELTAENSFWTHQARRLLADYLWNEGDVPRTKKLTLREISRDALLIAERWTD